MQMETASDKNDNSISLMGQWMYKHDLFKIFNHFMKATRCCLTLKECECHIDQKLLGNLKLNNDLGVIIDIP